MKEENVFLNVYLDALRLEGLRRERESLLDTIMWSFPGLFQKITDFIWKWSPFKKKSKMKLLNIYKIRNKNPLN